MQYGIQAQKYFIESLCGRARQTTLPFTAHTMFFIGTSNFELKLDFIIYSFLLRLYRDYRDYDALIMFNFHLFKKLNGSVFFREVLFLKFLTFKY